MGEKAPSFALTAITGETVALDTYKGKVIVLGLFHICDPCMVQGSALQNVSEITKGKDVAVLGVNSSGDSKKNIGEFLSTFPVNVSYPYLLDPGKVTDKLYGGGKFIPNVYVIDQQGIVDLNFRTVVEGGSLLYKRSRHECTHAQAFQWAVQGHGGPGGDLSGQDGARDCPGGWGASDPSGAVEGRAASAGSQPV